MRIRKIGSVTASTKGGWSDWRIVKISGKDPNPSSGSPSEIYYEGSLQDCASKLKGLREDALHSNQILKFYNQMVLTVYDPGEGYITYKMEQTQPVESATNTAGICAVPEVLGVDEIADDVETGEEFDIDEYVKTLSVEADPELLKYYDDLTWDYDDKGIYIYTVINQGPGESLLTDFTIPLDDLDKNWDTIKGDIKYIVDELTKDADPKKVESATRCAETDSAKITGADDDLVYRDPYANGEDYEHPDEHRYVALKSKPVLDSDGFFTDYTMYFIVDPEYEGGRYVMIFGDRDIYNPDNTEPDWVCETKEEADEWFNNYNGFEDDFIHDIDDVDESNYDPYTGTDYIETDDYLNDNW